MKYSPDLNLLKSYKNIISYITQYCKEHKKVNFLDVGGRLGKNKIVKNVNYNILEINEKLKKPYIIHGDICRCPQISDEKYDIVFSNNVFEHIKEPWLAAKECIRITKIGGLNIHSTVFSWRYHPDPIDCFRYTHKGMKILFEQLNNMEELLSGYDLSCRRRDHRGGKVKGGLDLVPVDDLGGWREHWIVIYIGRKI